MADQVQSQLDKIRTYKDAMALNLQYFLRHLVRGRVGHHIVSEIEREGLSPTQQRYGLSDRPDLSQNGIDVSNLEALANSIYIPHLFLGFTGFPVFSYDDRNGLSDIKESVSQRKFVEMIRFDSTIYPVSDKLSCLANDPAFRQDCLRYSELFLEVQLGRLKNAKLLEQVKTDPMMVELLTNLGKMYLSEIRS